MSSWVVVNDRTHKVVSVHDSKESAVDSLSERGYKHHSGWTYRNPDTRDYCHVSSRSQHESDNIVVHAAERAGMTVDAYLQS